MITVRATRRLVLARSTAAGPRPSDEPQSDDGPLGTWVANIVPLPFPGRTLVLFTAADTLLSVVAPGRSLRTTLPIFQRRVPQLLKRLGLPEPWIQARTGDLAGVQLARVGTSTADRRVLGTMIDCAVHLRAEALAAGAYEHLDLDRLEDRLASVLVGALRSVRSSHGLPADAVAELARS